MKVVYSLISSIFLKNKNCLHDPKDKSNKVVYYKFFLLKNYPIGDPQPLVQESTPRHLMNLLLYLIPLKMGENKNNFVHK